MLRRDRSRRRALAAAFAVAVHALMLGGLVFGLRIKRPDVEPPVMTVALLRLPPKPALAPPPPPRIHLHTAAKPSPDATLQPLPEPSPPAALAAPPGPFSDSDLRKLFQAPFADRVWPRPNLFDLCAKQNLSLADAEKCARLGRNLPPAPLAIPDRSGGAFGRAADRKDALRSYRNSWRGDDYPGLKCAFGRDCTPYRPPR